MLLLEGYLESSNIYLIEDDYTTLIDVGNDYTAYLELFQDVGKNPRDIKKVVLTHGHHDHVLGLIELIRYYPSFNDVTIFMHKTGPIGLKQVINKHCDQLDKNVTFMHVEGGETLELSGFEFRVIYTPGHTIDSICLYHEPTETLLSGDTILPQDLPIPDITCGGNFDDYLLSLRLLTRTKVTNLLPGHQMPIMLKGQEVVTSTYEGVIRSMIGQSSWKEGAEKLIMDNLMEEALICYNKWLEKYPYDEEAMGLKGTCLKDLGKLDEALKCFDELLTLNRKNAMAWFTKGLILLDYKRYKEALECFEEALKLKTNMREALAGKGFALYMIGRKDEAMKIAEFKEMFKA